MLLLINRKVNKKKEATINLKEATEIGLKLIKLILIAMKAEPQIALKTNNKRKLLDLNLCNKKNYLLLLGTGKSGESNFFIKSSL